MKQGTQSWCCLTTWIGWGGRAAGKTKSDLVSQAFIHSCNCPSHRHARLRVDAQSNERGNEICWVPSAVLDTGAGSGGRSWVPIGRVDGGTYVPRNPAGGGALEA